MRTKNEVFSKLKEYEAEVTNQTDKRIKVLRTDDGGEYTLKQFQDYLKMKGIVHQTTVPNSPQQNGVAERLNRTINEIALAQIVHANAPRNLWAESVGAAVYIRNRIPMATIGITPYQRFFGHKPKVDHLRILVAMDIRCYQRQSVGSWCQRLRNCDWLVMDRILQAIDYLMRKSRSLLFDVTFNLMRMILESKK